MTFPAIMENFKGRQRVHSRKCEKTSIFPLRIEKAG